MVGGETKSSLWNQIKADIIGLPIKIPEASEATAALGSAILAGVGSGVYKNVQEGMERCIRSVERYNPRIDVHEKYMKIHEKYRKVYDVLSPAYTVIAVI